MHILQSWNASTTLAAALMLIAAAMLVLGVGLVRRLRGQSRSRQVVDQARPSGAPTSIGAYSAPAAIASRGSMPST